MLLSLVLKYLSVTPKILPIVIYHGMGDSCCSAPMEAFIAELRIGLKQPVFIHPIRIGSDPGEDRRKSLFDNVDRQIEEVCEQLKGIPELAGGFNAIGISQVTLSFFPF